MGNKNYNEVVVTGMGALSSIGFNVPDMIKNISIGRRNFSYIQDFDVSSTNVCVAAQILNYDPHDFLTNKLISKMSREEQFGYIAASEALHQAHITPSKKRKKNFGVIVGSGITGLCNFYEQTKKEISNGIRSISPLFYPKCLTNMTANNISINYGAGNINLGLSNACASGTDAIGLAFHYLRCKQADIICVIGTDAGINPLGIGGFAALHALSTSKNLNNASIPFDINRNGFVMGEGAAALILETKDHAKKRNAKILGKIVGYQTRSDAYNLVSPSKEGVGLRDTLISLLRNSGIKNQEVGYINAHGTSTKANDYVESSVLSSIFTGNNTLISSTKGFTGHMLGAAGVIEAVITLNSLKTGVLPVNIGLISQDPECKISIVNNSNNIKNIKYAISESLAFGGSNSALILEKSDEY